MFHDYSFNLYLFINGIWLAANIKLIGIKAHTLKLTQNISDWVLQTISLSMATNRKNKIQRWLSIFHPSFSRFSAFWKNIFYKGFCVKNLPKNKTPAKSKLIMVGFI